MQKTILTLIAFATTLTLILALTSTTATAQIYNEACKEDLRALARQFTNYEKLGLTIEDTLTGYDNEEGIHKDNSILKNSIVGKKNTSDAFHGIEIISLINLGLEGKIRIRSPIISRISLRNNAITELDLDEYDKEKIESIDIAQNKLSKIDVSMISYPYGIGFHIGDNLITELIAGDCIFWSFNIYDNLFSDLDFSSFKTTPTSPGINFRCWNNLLKFSTMRFSAGPFGFTGTNPQYAPQATIFGAAIYGTGPVDLSAEYVINEEHITSFEGFDITTGEELPITQPHNNLGVFTFTQEHEGKKLRCKMNNDMFPLLTQIYETDILVGIQEVTPISDFTLFPNPSQTKALIQFNLLQDDNVTIEIYDLFGNIVFNKTEFFSAGDNKHPLDLNDYVCGSYTCLLSAKGQQIGVVNFVVSR